jgi:hypothetical protein
MMVSVVPFVTAIVVPACGFYLYALGHFLREALQMRRERLSAMRFAESDESALAPVRSSSTVLTFLSHRSHPSHRGAA